MGTTVSETAQARLIFGKATEFSENRKAILPRFSPFLLLLEVHFRIEAFMLKPHWKE